MASVRLTASSRRSSKVSNKSEEGELSTADSSASDSTPPSSCTSSTGLPTVDKQPVLATKNGSAANDGEKVTYDEKWPANGESYREGFRLAFFGVDTHNPETAHPLRRSVLESLKWKLGTCLGDGDIDEEGSEQRNAKLTDLKAPCQCEAASSVTTACSSGDFQDTCEGIPYRQALPETSRPFYSDPFESAERFSREAKDTPKGPDDSPVGPEWVSQPPPLYEWIAQTMCEACVDVGHGDERRNIIILDWDDTIFPSSWIHVAQRCDQGDASSVMSSEVCLDVVAKTRLSVEQEAAMAEVESSALALIAGCCRLGRLYIITNAESGWVQLSASHFMPRVFAFLADHGVPIISARACFNQMRRSVNPERLGAIEPDLWKVHTFSSLLRRIVAEEPLLIRCAVSPRTDGRRQVSRRVKFAAARPEWSLTRSHKRGASTTRTADRSMLLTAPSAATKHVSKIFHFLSIGDSECERRALLTCREELYHYAYFKSIKLVEGPHPLLLVRQQNLLRATLVDILAVTDCVDLVFVEPARESLVACPSPAST